MYIIGARLIGLQSHMCCLAVSRQIPYNQTHCYFCSNNKTYRKVFIRYVTFSYPMGLMPNLEATLRISELYIGSKAMDYLMSLTCQNQNSIPSFELKHIEHHFSPQTKLFFDFLIKIYIWIILSPFPTSPRSNSTFLSTQLHVVCF